LPNTGRLLIYFIKRGAAGRESRQPAGSPRWQRSGRFALMNYFHPKVKFCFIIGSPHGRAVALATERAFKFIYPLRHSFVVPPLPEGEALGWHNVWLSNLCFLYLFILREAKRLPYKGDIIIRRRGGVSPPGRPYGLWQGLIF